MEFSLDELVVELPPNPTREFSTAYDWEDYLIRAFYKGEQVATITISRALKPLGEKRSLSHGTYNSDNFFFDMSQSPALPKPFIAFKETDKNYRGKGICGHITSMANEFYRGKLGTTIYSDTTFCCESAKTVWKKLVLAGKAEYCPERNKDRWRML
jgi:hypothetical protein